jgi:hypothetical protein
MIESLQSLPDASQRMLDAIDHLWRNRPHDAIAEFQDSLQLARENEELGAATSSSFSCHATTGAVRDAISDALRFQLAALSGLQPQFDTLDFTSMEPALREEEANGLIHLNHIAGSVMRPLACLGGGEKMRVMQAIVDGKPDTGHPLVNEAYEREKKDYLALHAGNEADATAAFEKAFLCKAIPLLGGDSASDAISIVNGPGSHEKIKSDLNVLLTHYRAFMCRVCDM